MNKKDALALVSKNAHIFPDLSPELQNDKEVALAAVKQNGRIFPILSKELKEDKEVVLATINQDGRFLQFLPEFKDDKDVVLAAVKQNGQAFEFASRDLKEDKEVILAAVKQNESLSMLYNKLNQNDLIHLILSDPPRIAYLDNISWSSVISKILIINPALKGLLKNPDLLSLINKLEPVYIAPKGTRRNSFKTRTNVPIISAGGHDIVGVIADPDATFRKLQPLFKGKYNDCAINAMFPVGVLTKESSELLANVCNTYKKSTDDSYLIKLVSFNTGKGVKMEEWKIDQMFNFVKKYRNLPRGAVLPFFLNRYEVGHRVIFYFKDNEFILVDSVNPKPFVICNYSYWDFTSKNMKDWMDYCKYNNYISFSIMVYDDSVPVEQTQPFFGGKTHKFKCKSTRKKKYK